MKKIYSVLLAAVLGGNMIIGTSAIIPGVSPDIDPTVIKDMTLPEKYDQSFRDGMPYGVFVVGDDASYSFGTATDRHGNLYTASFNRSDVTVRKPDKNGRISLDSETETIRLGCPGLFCIAIDANGDLLFSSCTDKDGWIGRYGMKTGQITKLITGLVRPNQMAVDGNNNVYAVCENGNIYRYNDADGSVDTVAEGLGGLQSCTVAADGTVYVLSYGVFSDDPIVGVAYAGGTLWQIRDGREPEVVYAGNQEFVWRARGLICDELGYVCLTGEGNAWDNGNSSVIARFDPGTRKIEKVTSGLDYATVIAYGKDGRFYQCLARDDLVVACSEKAEKGFSEQDGWSDGIKVISYGGTFVPDSGGVKVKIGSLSLSAGIKTDGKHGKVCGWIRVPAELLPETDNTWTGDNNGKYPLPQASLSGNGRGRCAVMPARTHTRSRWPLPDIYTPAADFRDNPEAYLVYFEWTPEGSEEKADPDEFRDTDRAPAGLSYGISSGISGLERSPAFAGKSDRRTYSLDFSKGTGFCTVGSGISFAIKTEKSGQTPALTVLADNTGAEGRGLRAIFGTGGRLNVAFSGGKPEITVFDGYIGYDIFDGEWHTFRLENSFGKYALVIDGIVVTCDGFDAAADEYCSGNALSLRLSGSGGLSVGVRAEGKKTAGTIEPVQEKLPAKKPDAAAILCIAAAVTAAAAAITVVAGRRKETSTFFERK